MNFRPIFDHQTIHIGSLIDMGQKKVMNDIVSIENEHVSNQMENGYETRRRPDRRRRQWSIVSAAVAIRLFFCKLVGYVLGGVPRSPKATSFFSFPP